MTQGEEVNAVRFMRPNVVDIVLSALEKDGMNGASGTTAHKMDILKISDRCYISVSIVGSSFADTASEKAGICKDPFDNHHHWPCKAHRTDLEFQDLFKSCREEIQIFDPFIKMPTFLLGKRQQRTDALRTS